MNSSPVTRNIFPNCEWSIHIICGPIFFAFEMLRLHFGSAFTHVDYFFFLLLPPPPRPTTKPQGIATVTSQGANRRTENKHKNKLFRARAVAIALMSQLEPTASMRKLKCGHVAQLLVVRRFQNRVRSLAVRRPLKTRIIQELPVSWTTPRTLRR